MGRVIERAYIGSTRPSPLVPKPVPSVHPIILRSLFPTLLVSCPGFRGAGGGVGGLGGPLASRLAIGFDVCAVSGMGASGWLNNTRRSDARSRYLGACAFCTFCRAVSRNAESLRFVCTMVKQREKTEVSPVTERRQSTRGKDASLMQIRFLVVSL